MCGRWLFLGVALVAVVAVMSAGCAKPPTADLEAAEAALAAARAAGATVYAQDELSAAEEAMAAVEAEMAAQEGKMGMFRSYAEAEELIKAATSAAQEAEDAAVVGKKLARDQAIAARDAAQASAARVQELLAALEACRRKPKGFKSDMEMLRGAADGLQVTLGEVDTAIADETYLEAKTKAESAQSQLDELAADLEQAKAKIRC
jgi:hypothetical protein